MFWCSTAAREQVLVVQALVMAFGTSDYTLHCCCIGRSLMTCIESQRADETRNHICSHPV
jgi:hypothetical protein